MKKYLWGIVCLLCLTSCGGKDKNAPDTEADSIQTAAQRPGGIVEDTPWHNENSVTWNGHTYQYVLNRAADKSLPTVKDELGQPYYDNSVTLNVKRDGEVFVARKFTKEDFADFLTKDYQTNAALLGLAFDKVADDGLHFGAMIGYAGSMEGGMLFTVVLASDGTVSIIRGEQPEAPGA